jgi:replicative DNA helicase
MIAELTSDYEKLVIESILKDNDAYYGLGLTPIHFDDPQHREVYKVLSGMIDRSLEANIVTLSAETDIPASQIAGYDPVSAANSEYYAEVLKEKRRLIDIRATLRDVIDRGGDSSELIDFASSELVKIANNNQSGLVRIESLASATMQRMEHGSDRGISSGFGFDSMTGGFRPSELCILAARTSIGKTALALNMAQNMASYGVNVAYFSCEMSNAEMMDRLLSGTTLIGHQEIRRGKLTEEGVEHVLEKLSVLQEESLWFCDTPNIKFEDLRNQSRAFCAKGGEIIFIDYLTLVKYGDSRTPRHERVGQLSAELKALARELEVPIIALSQLNRESEGQTPSLATIRQSGEIEENADMIMLLHRDRDTKEAELIIAKHRNGPTGSVVLKFDERTLRFS